MAWRRNPVLWMIVAIVVAMAGVPAAVLLSITQGPAEDQPAAAFRTAVVAVLLLGPLLAVAVAKIHAQMVARPLAQLTVAVRALALGEGRDALPAGRFDGLAPLPEAIDRLAAALAAKRREITYAVAGAVGRAEEQKGRLAAILNDLHQGVVVCNLSHQVVLYNQVALKLLAVTGELGLGRSLFNMVGRDPVLHTLDLLTHRPPASERGAPFLSGTIDGRTLLQGRMSLISAGGEVTGYVVTFDDITAQIAALGRRDALLREAVAGVRGPAGRLLVHGGDPEAVRRETTAITTCLDRVVAEMKGGLAVWWPMSDVHSGDLFDFVARRMAGAGPRLTITGLPVWLHGDSHGLVLALEALVRRVATATGVVDFDLAASRDGERCSVDVAWQGEAISERGLARLLAEPVSGMLGGLTVGDVLRHHDCEPALGGAQGFVWVRLPLPRGREAEMAGGEVLPPRPEFFDFDLLRQDADTGGLGQLPLKALTYVVFDTETTGLAPSQGDQIVSIAGVRIVNGRILTGETFSRLVNPGRPIPPESIKFHGITDAMVRDKPPLPVVLPQFKAYAAESVLVAHNAAFDLKFIRMREHECGLRFDNPVLDTMLLSAYVDGTREGQSLDAIAERLGIRVTDRHTALGDAMATAAVLVKLIDGLEQRGIHTLDQAVKTLDITMELHQRQAAF